MPKLPSQSSVVRFRTRVVEYPQPTAVRCNTIRCPITPQQSTRSNTVLCLQKKKETSKYASYYQRSIGRLAPMSVYEHQIAVSARLFVHFLYKPSSYLPQTALSLEWLLPQTCASCAMSASIVESFAFAEITGSQR